MNHPLLPWLLRPIHWEEMCVHINIYNLLYSTTDYMPVKCIKSLIILPCMIYQKVLGWG